MGIIWRYAFECGKGIGHYEGTRTVELDIEQIESTAAEIAFKRGVKYGQIRAQSTADHSNDCITVACPPRNIAVQTDTPELPPPHYTTTTAIQTENPTLAPVDEPAAALFDNSNSPTLATTSTPADASYTICHVPTPSATSYDDDEASKPPVTPQIEPKSQYFTLPLVVRPDSSRTLLVRWTPAESGQSPWSPAGLKSFSSQSPVKFRK